MKDNFPQALVFILASEGGYVNHPADRGGETNMGIAKKYYPDEDIAGLTTERAGEIYRRDYWDRVRGDDLPSGVDYAVFDSSVNHGVRNAGLFLQRAVNRYGAAVAVDGAIGPRTVLAVRSCNCGGELIHNILRERDIFYRKIIATDPTQEVFLKGWMKRLAHVAKNTKEFSDG